MTGRIDDLNPRARWYLNNFDEIDLADTCASQEAALGRVEELATSVDDPTWRAPGTEVAGRIRLALRHDQPAAHDDGPTVAEADRKSVV